MNEFHRDLHILDFARRRLGTTKPYATPVSKTNLNGTVLVDVQRILTMVAYFFDKLETFRKKMVGEREDVRHL